MNVRVVRMGDLVGEESDRSVSGRSPNGATNRRERRNKQHGKNAIPPKTCARFSTKLQSAAGVSHEMNVVSKLADHVLCLEGGRIKCQGAPREILTNEMLAQTFGADMAVYAHHGH